MARSANAVNALIHLYRAEVGRMTAYRARLDTTTNWAITTSALVATFTLGNPEISHVAFLFLMLLNYFFLMLEARRFRHYEASRYRAQFLEQTFYPEILDHEIDPRWVETLLESIKRPGPTIGTLDAIGWRLWRNYLWIYFGVLLAWIGKLETTGPATTEPSGLILRATFGSVPGWQIWLLVLGLYAWLVGLAFWARRHSPDCEDW